MRPARGSEQHPYHQQYGRPHIPLQPGQPYGAQAPPQLPSPSGGTHFRPKVEADAMGGPSNAVGAANAKGGASEFVKKLYKMLEDSAHHTIVSWGAKGDSFLVKDMNEFTKTVLPLHFKHSNFASFVRQLNKYDFHKVKASEGGEGIYGDHTWEFKHANFRADTKKSLEFIKRKGPAPRKGGGMTSASAGPPIIGRHPQTTPVEDGASGVLQLQQQFSVLQQVQQSMGAHMTSMSTDLHNVYAELVKFQNTFVAQDQLIQNIIQYLVRKETVASASDRAPNAPSAEAQQLLSSYAEIAHASAEQLAELTRRASIAGGRFSPPILNDPASQPASTPSSGFEQEPLSPHTANSGQFPRVGINQTYQHLTATEALGQQQATPSAGSPATRTDFYPSPLAATPAGPGSAYFSPTEDAQQNPQQYQKAFHAPTSAANNGAVDAAAAVAPGGNNGAAGTWKHTPRVLVVEDDVVCRRLSSRFLEVFGCIIDTAEDGVEAVKKMNAQPYDLVFMDISMPNLDGVSATSIIRQFNSSTPIVSMTSNSEPNDILTYFSHGMTDVLPKPFTKEALRTMLEKHLVHLTQIKQLVEVPRALGFPEGQIQDALASTLAPSYLQSEPMFGQEPLNPFTEMGITDADFTSVLLSTLTPGVPGSGTSPTPIDAGGPEGPQQTGKRPNAEAHAVDSSKRPKYHG